MDDTLAGRIARGIAQSGSQVDDDGQDYEPPWDEEWGASLLNEQVEKVAKARPGSRSRTLFQAACTLFKAANGGHVNHADVFIRLGHAADDEANLSGERVIRVLSSAQEAAGNETFDPGDVEEVVEFTITESTWAQLPRVWRLGVIDDVIKKSVPTSFVRDDGAKLLYPGRLHMFFGAPESCKTWAALVVIAQEVRAGRVGLLVDMEDSYETAVERLKYLGLSREQIADDFIYLGPDTKLDAEARLLIEAELGDREPGVAVIDSMTEAMSVEGLDPDKGLAVAQFYKHLLPNLLTELKFAVVVIDHVPKSGAVGKYSIGSERKVSGLTGAAYQFKSVQPFGRGNVGKVSIEVTKDRPGYVRQFAEGDKIGTLVLSSNPVDWMVDATFQAPSVVDEVAEAAKKLDKVWSQLETEFKAHDRVDLADLKVRVKGADTLINAVLKQKYEDRVVDFETGPRGKKTYWLRDDPPILAIPGD